MLRLRHFKKYYNGRLALSIEHVEIPFGIHWIQGSNGSGKTTFFRSLAGIIPSEGSVVLQPNLDLHEEPLAYRLKVNYAEAEPAYPHFLSGKDLIRFVGKTKKAPQGQEENLVHQFDIQDFYTNPIGTYSSGMLKKISLVIAFLGQPSLILLDEPLVTIDQQALSAVYELIRQYYQKGCGFLISSHQAIENQELPIGHTYRIQNQSIETL